MAKASKIFAFTGTIFGFLAFATLLVLAILGFIGIFTYIPSIFDENNKYIFYICMILYGLLMAAVAYLSLRHYLLIKNNIYNQRFSVVLIIDGILTLNIFLIISAILSLIILKDRNE